MYRTTLSRCENPPRGDLSPTLPLCWTASLRVDLETLGTRGYPHEVCGLLIGRLSSDRTRIKSITQARNRRTDRPEDRYDLDPQDFLDADAAARRNGLDVVGIWHTHPDHPPEPSRADLASAWEGFSYVILSVRRTGVASIRCWRFDGSRFAEQPIKEVTR